MSFILWRFYFTDATSSQIQTHMGRKCDEVRFSPTKWSKCGNFRHLLKLECSHFHPCILYHMTIRSDEKHDIKLLLLWLKRFWARIQDFWAQIWSKTFSENVEWYLYIDMVIFEWPIIVGQQLGIFLGLYSPDRNRQGFF